MVLTVDSGVSKAIGSQKKICLYLVEVLDWSACDLTSLHYR